MLSLWWRPLLALSVVNLALVVTVGLWLTKKLRGTLATLQGRCFTYGGCQISLQEISVDKGSIAFLGWRGLRLACVGVRLVVVVRFGETSDSTLPICPTVRLRGQWRHAEAHRHVARAYTGTVPPSSDGLKAQVADGLSWIIQIGSRHHPLWPLLLPLLTLTRQLPSLMRFIKVLADHVRCEVQFVSVDDPLQSQRGEGVALIELDSVTAEFDGWSRNSERVCAGLRMLWEARQRPSIEFLRFVDGNGIAEPIIDFPGCLRFEVGLSWPPELSPSPTSGFECLSRPPLLPEWTSLSWEAPVKIVVSGWLNMLQALSSSTAALKRVSNESDGRGMSRAEDGELLSVYLQGAQLRNGQRNSSLLDFLEAFDWTRFALSVPAVDIVLHGVDSTASVTIGLENLTAEVNPNTRHATQSVGAEVTLHLLGAHVFTRVYDQDCLRTDEVLSLGVSDIRIGFTGVWLSDEGFSKVASYPCVLAGCEIDVSVKCESVLLDLQSDLHTCVHGLPLLPLDGMQRGGTKEVLRESYWHFPFRLRVSLPLVKLAYEEQGMQIAPQAKHRYGCILSYTQCEVDAFYKCTPSTAPSPDTLSIPAAQASARLGELRAALIVNRAVTSQADRDRHELEVFSLRRLGASVLYDPSSGIPVSASFTVEELQLEWSPALFCGLSRLAEPLYCNSGSPSTATSRSEDQGTGDGGPLCMSTVLALLHAPLTNEPSAMTGTVNTICVSFPYCLTRGIGQMGEEDVWDWLKSRGSSGPDQWDVEEVHVKQAWFMVPRFEGAVAPWTLRVLDCSVRSRHNRSPYCQVCSFATRQVAQVSSLFKSSYALRMRSSL
jgi:hypothetical protein